MRTSLAARLGSRLLLTLALCACGGGGDDSGAAADSVASAPAAASAAIAAAAADTCTGPPPTFAMSLLNGGTWQAFTTALADSGVTFPDTAGNVDTLAVPLYRNGTPVRMEIRSGNSTPCLAARDLNGSNPRILGEYVLLEAFSGGQGWDALPAGSRIYAFAQSAAGQAVMVYQNGDRTKRAPASSWQFWFCKDGHQNPRTPQARWRPRTQTGTGDGDGDGDGDTGGGGSYGWMACISGCCQFYTPPPNETMNTPPQASEKAPDTVGKGVNQGQPVRPPWCNATS